MFVFMKAWYLGRHLIGIVQSWQVKKVYLARQRCRNSWPRFFQQRLYITTDRGLFIRNMGTGKFENLNTRNSDLPSDYIYFVYADSKIKMLAGHESDEVRIVEDDWQSGSQGKMVTQYYENNEGLWFVSTDSRSKQEMWLIDHYNRYYDAGFGTDLYQGTFNDFLY